MRDLSISLNSLKQKLIPIESRIVRKGGLGDGGWEGGVDNPHGAGPCKRKSPPGPGGGG